MQLRPRPLEHGEPVTVVQLDPTVNEHLHAFDEVSRSLAEGMRVVGIDARHVVGAVEPGRRNVLLGAHTLPDDALATLPEGTIVYNHEQIDPTSLVPPRRLQAFARLGVWDYSRRNVEGWAAQGVAADHVPIGWSPGLATIERSTDPDIDVLFYGSINERRQRVLEAIRRKGVRVEVAFGVYGRARDALIARSRLVINIQFYEARILELVRLSYLFANGVPVVSETDSDIDAPAGFADAAAFATYDRLAGTALELLADPSRLEAQGRRGRERMEAWPWSRALAGVLPTDRAAGSGAASTPSASGVDLTLVCGAVGPETTSDDPTAVRGRELTDALLGLAHVDRDWLGPPPQPDPESDPGVSAWRDEAVAWLSDSAVAGPVRLSDPAISLVLPQWLEVADRAGRTAEVELVIRSPADQAVPPGGATIESVLSWLSAVLFAEAFSREVPRRLVVSGGEVEVDRLVPTQRFAAMELAAQVHRALRSPTPDLEVVDAAADRYLDAMALYFPLLQQR